MLLSCISLCLYVGEDALLVFFTTRLRSTSYVSPCSSSAPRVSDSTGVFSNKSACRVRPLSRMAGCRVFDRRGVTEQQPASSCSRQRTPPFLSGAMRPRMFGHVPNVFADFRVGWKVGGCESLFEAELGLPPPGLSLCVEIFGLVRSYVEGRAASRRYVLSILFINADPILSPGCEPCVRRWAVKTHGRRPRTYARVDPPLSYQAQSSAQQCSLKTLRFCPSTIRLTHCYYVLPSDLCPLTSADLRVFPGNQENHSFAIQGDSVSA